MKKLMLGLALLIATSFALAGTEIRVHEQRSSSDAGWQAFYLELMNQKVVADDDTVPAKALLHDVCFRKEVTPYCTRKEDGTLEPVDLLVAGFQKRNGLPDRVKLVEYRVLAHSGGKGSFLPLPGSVTELLEAVPAIGSVAVAPANVVTTSATATALATDSTADKALEAEFAQVKQTARDARGLTEAQAKALATLQGKIDTANADRSALKQKLDAAGKGVEAAAVKAAAPAASQAAEAERKAEAAIEATNTFTGAVAEVKRGFADIKPSLQEAVQESSTAKYWAAIAIIGVLCLGGVMFYGSRRQKMVSVSAPVTKYVSTADLEVKLDRAIQPLILRINTADTVAKGATAATTVFSRRLNEFDERLNEAEASIAATETATATDWRLSSEELEAIKVATIGLKEGEQSQPVLLALPKCGVMTLAFTGAGGDNVFIDGVKDPRGRRRAVSKKHLHGVIRGFDARGEVVGIGTSPILKVVS